MSRRLLLSFVFALVAIVSPLAVSAQLDAPNIGVKFGYVSKNKSALAGAFFQYSFTKNIRIAPEIACVIQNDNMRAINADLNMHFPLDLTSGHCKLYPIVGLDFASWHISGIYNLDTELVPPATHKRLGVNIGAGFEILTKRNVKFRFEWKYTLTPKYSTTVVDFGYAYLFNI